MLAGYSYREAPVGSSLDDGNLEDLDVVIEGPDDLGSTIDPISGAMKIEDGEGGVTIDLNPKDPLAKSIDADDFDANLAEVVGFDEISRLASELLESIDADDQSRDQWLRNRADGIELLGLKLETPASGSANTASGSTPGMALVRHPLLAEAVVKFQANAAAELFPTTGPVKVRSDRQCAPPGEPNTEPYRADDLADALETNLNHYLTVRDRGYRTDFVRMLFWVGFGGCGFRKVYYDPIRRMPISRAIEAEDVIVNNSTNDLDDAGRVTHRIRMRDSAFIRMKLAGIYRDIECSPPSQSTRNEVEDKKAEVLGFDAVPRRHEDYERVIDECYCELDLDGFQHKDENGNITGLPLPYRVSIDRASRQILEIRRNWKDGDTTYRARKRIVKYPFIPAMGFYDIGLLQLVGNTDKVLTATWRMLLDAGMYANFPGFLYSEPLGKQLSNQFRVPPGGGVPIKTGGKPISDLVIPMPYKEPSPVLLQLAQAVEASGQRVAGTAETQALEGKQEAPVGTTLAIIEQATKVLSAVHINLHAAQAEEFQLLKELFAEYPESLCEAGPRSGKQWEIAELIAALNDNDIVPAADPNTPSHVHRLMKLQALKQLQSAAPMLYNAYNVDEYILRQLGIGQINMLMNPQGTAQAPPPPDPKLMALKLKADSQQSLSQARMAEQQAAAQAAAQTNQLKFYEMQQEAAARAADRGSRERVANTRLQAEVLKTQLRAGANGKGPALSLAGVAAPPVAATPTLNPFGPPVLPNG